MCRTKGVWKGSSSGFKDPDVITILRLQDCFYYDSNTYLHRYLQHNWIHIHNISRKHKVLVLFSNTLEFMIENDRAGRGLVKADSQGFFVIE